MSIGQGNLSQFFGAGFDSQNIAPMEDFQVLPPGKYPVIIETAEIKQTKGGNGHYIALQFVVLDGPHKGRKLWDRINIDNPSVKCVEIGMSCLQALVKSLGFPCIEAVRDTVELLNRSCVAHAKVDGEYNSIRTYSPFDDAASVQAPPPAPAPPTTAAQPVAPPTPVASPHPTPGFTTASPIPMTPTPPPTGELPWKR